MSRPFIVTGQAKWTWILIWGWFRTEFGFASDLEWCIRSHEGLRLHALLAVMWSNVSDHREGKGRRGGSVKVILGPFILKMGVVEP